MNASKEEAACARARIEEISFALDLWDNIEICYEIKRKLLLVDNFLEVANRKLPSEASYTKEIAKRKARSK